MARHNGFLAAGLVWSLIGRDLTAIPIRTCLLGCVVVAGIHGGLTAAREILLVQAVPALAARAVTILIR